MVDDISHEGLRVVLREEGVSFQVIKTGKQSNDADFEAKKNRTLELYAIADGKADAGPGDPTVVFCMDEFGPLNLQPHPGKQWAPPTLPPSIGSGDGRYSADSSTNATPPTDQQRNTTPTGSPNPIRRARPPGRP